MSVVRCEIHSRHWDSDLITECPVCRCSVGPKTHVQLMRMRESVKEVDKFIEMILYWDNWSPEEIERIAAAKLGIDKAIDDLHQIVWDRA